MKQITCFQFILRRVRLLISRIDRPIFLLVICVVTCIEFRMYYYADPVGAKIWMDFLIISSIVFGDLYFTALFAMVIAVDKKISSWETAQNLTIRLCEGSVANFQLAIVERDHRAIKQMIKAMSGFEAFWSAATTIAGIEIMHMIRKGEL
jgi:hypothetical protein